MNGRDRSSTIALCAFENPPPEPPPSAIDAFQRRNLHIVAAQEVLNWLALSQTGVHSMRVIKALREVIDRAWIKSTILGRSSSPGSIDVLAFLKKESTTWITRGSLSRWLTMALAVDCSPSLWIIFGDLMAAIYMRCHDRDHRRELTSRVYGLS